MIDEVGDESFERTYEAATPHFNRDRSLKYVAPPARLDSVSVVAPGSTTSQLNGEDFLARVAVVIHNHVKRGENAKQMRMNNIHSGSMSGSLSFPQFGSASERFNEASFVRPQIQYSWIRSPHLIPLASFVSQEVSVTAPHIPGVKVIHNFILKLFKGAELSSECSLVSLVYIERLMELSDVRLDASNWRPITMSAMLTASKVWQDLASWNIEFAQVYPQFPLKAINQLETMFLTGIKWKTVIDQQLYTKYYFALRSKTEEKNFRQRYNILVNVSAPNATRLETRSKKVEAILLSRSL